MGRRSTRNGASAERVEGLGSSVSLDLSRNFVRRLRRTLVVTSNGDLDDRALYIPGRYIPIDQIELHF